MVEKRLDPGRYLLNWDGSDLPVGVYLARLTAGEEERIIKMVLMK